MLTHFKSLFFFLLLLAGSLYADVGSGYLGQNCCEARCNRWELDAEFLYFLPSFDDTYFLVQGDINDVNNISGTRINNNFHFRPGFRIGAGCELCGCCDGKIQIAYSRLSAKQTRNVTGSFLYPTVGPVDVIEEFEDFTGSASSRLNFLYQRVDGLYGHPLWCDNCFKIDALIGLEYAYLRYGQHYDFQLATGALTHGTVDELAKLSAIGPEFGFDLNYLINQFACRFPGALSVTANVYGSILTGRNHASMIGIVSIAPQVRVNVQDEHTWRTIPALHSRIGLNYATCLARWSGSVEVGYEFSTYLRGLSRTIFPDDEADAQSFNNYYDFSVQGLYVAVSAAF